MDKSESNIRVNGTDFVIEEFEYKQNVLYLNIEDITNHGLYIFKINTRKNEAHLKKPKKIFGNLNKSVELLLRKKYNIIEIFI